MKHFSIPLGGHRVLGPITLRNLDREFSTEVGHLHEHDHGMLELNLLMLPTASSVLEFAMPRRVGPEQPSSPLTAVVPGTISDVFIQIGVVEIDGRAASVTFFGHTDFAARFVFWA